MQGCTYTFDYLANSGMLCDCAVYGITSGIFCMVLVFAVWCFISFIVKCFAKKSKNKKEG